ncbi:anosmin-1-like isoform X2 [Protopterus annectens]|uniref:anosmin-1-like isoform X2 n=1 Tax=Protopterus annectens TaxID=7888 RepID=UPI001CF9A321|nr:anosmin-1-like isoform X2 [Protopterus annectens]
MSQQLRMWGCISTWCHLVVLTLITSARVAARDAEAGATAAQIRSVRCTSRCLALHITQLTSSFGNLQNDDILMWCKNNRRCSQCLLPCTEQLDLGRNQCQKKCEKHHECITSCEFLKSVQAVKQGDCPLPQKASGFAAACVQSCNTDTECSGTKKCCPNGCGYTCQAPASIHKGVPLKPRKDMIFNEDTTGNLQVSWMSKFNVTVEPVLYIVQRRWNYGAYPSEDDATEWQTVAVTTENHFLLKDTRPNRWYQFRVAAINIHGTRGFTAPSKYFCSTRDPLPPSSPKNIRRGNFTTNHDGTINVHVYWDSPQDGDLAVHHYKVFWNQWVPKKRVLSAKKDNWKISDGKVPETELEGLHLGTKYIVQVQAVGYWGQKRLKSTKSRLIFEIPISGEISKPPAPIDEVSNELPIAHAVPGSIESVDVTAPHYSNNQLQIKVYWKKAEEESHAGASTYLIKWKPVLCTGNISRPENKATVQDTHFVISGLLFACKYKITLQPVTIWNHATEVTTFLTTPKCSSIKARGSKRLICDRDGSALHHSGESPTYDFIQNSSTGTFNSRRWASNIESLPNPTDLHYHFLRCCTQLM